MAQQHGRASRGPSRSTSRRAGARDAGHREPGVADRATPTSAGGTARSRDPAHRAGLAAGRRPGRARRVARASPAARILRAEGRHARPRPTQVAGLRRRRQRAAAATTADYLRTALAAGIDLDETRRRGLRRPGRRADRSVLFFGGTDADLVTPGARPGQPRSSCWRTTSGSGRPDLREVPAGDARRRDEVRHRRRRRRAATWRCAAGPTTAAWRWRMFPEPRRPTPRPLMRRDPRRHPDPRLTSHEPVTESKHDGAVTRTLNRRPTPSGSAHQLEVCPAVSYSPTPSRVQYHRRWRA